MGKNKVNREFTPAVRTTNGVFIYFKDKETVYVKDLRSGRWMLYHRWFETTPGFYMNSWRKFCWRLKYVDSLDFDNIVISSIRFGVQAEIPRFIPEIKPNLKVFPERRERTHAEENNTL